jgi:hypothetical protein
MPIICGHFDTIEFIEAESQAVLNTLKEHDFQDKIKKTKLRCLSPRAHYTERPQLVGDVNANFCG